MLTNERKILGEKHKMKKERSYIKKFSWIIPAIILLPVLSGAAISDELGYALLVQQSPVDGGTVNPGLGVLKIGAGETLTLTAHPSPGYHFVYWLGDVIDRASQSTRVQIDSPKLVIAIYERDDFEEELPMQLSAGLGGAAQGGSGARYTPVNVSGGGAVSGGGGGGHSFNPYNPPIIPPEIKDDEFPVPGPGDNSVPEPASVCLLIGGSVFLRRRKSRKIISGGPKQHS